MEDSVYQLVYISAAKQDFSESELEELLALARTNNKSLNVSGMLLFHEGSFIQALEGEKATVEKLYEKIGQDPRHIETRVLFRGELEQRDFEGWSMGFYRSAQSSSANLKGFHQFLKTGFRRRAEEDQSLARKALLKFREGGWRQSVDA